MGEGREEGRGLIVITSSSLFPPIPLLSLSPNLNPSPLLLFPSRAEEEGIAEHWRPHVAKDHYQKQQRQRRDGGGLPRRGELISGAKKRILTSRMQEQKTPLLQFQFLSL